MQKKPLFIVRLAVHLEGTQTILFPEGGARRAVEDLQLKDSILLTFFKLSQQAADSSHFSEDDVDPRTLTYDQIPDPTSFTALRVVDDIQHDSFESATRALGLLRGDNQWILCMEGAVRIILPQELRTKFAQILLFNSPTMSEVTKTSRFVKLYVTIEY
ncbi:hypothetical protein BLNAU_619 [Blattamonas nauphoetae]|uniref:Uncharacterized protein n=1 Tax=Blattamonas nauphoetae TaxID=2049346 RepID=A0ABQ9YK29_9EUKA|nr:hypothetical protein BLNAU_619 [Blattamonas nauphoetae]